MQFKIKNINITISFTFFALILMLIISKKTDYLYTSIFSALLHEIGHLCALKHFGADILEFKISLFGGNIKTMNFNKTSYLNEIIVCFSGPAINLLLSLFFYLFYFAFHKKELLIYSNINLILGLYNLLPFYSFDGGKIVELILKNKYSEKRTDLVITILSILILIPFSYISFVVFFSNTDNFYLALVSIFMLLTIILKK